MNSRERTLAVACGALLLLVVGAFVVRGVRSMIDGRRQREIGLQKEISQKERKLRLGQPITDRMEVYEQHALPSDVQAAGTLYQTWLLRSVTEVDLDDANVNAITSKGKEGTNHEFAFNVSGRGDLRQLVRFLHKFYSVDYLHRIKRLHLRRIADSRRLDLTLAVEAMSLPTATREKELSQNPGERLKQDDLATYMERITSRNLSGPANREPEFASKELPKAYLQKPFSFRFKSQDPDKWDVVTFSLEASNLPEATLDPKAGELQWTPKEIGNYELTLKITDDGLPPKSATKSFKIEVEDPDAIRDAKATDFAQGQSAYVTAITQVDDRRQAWINLRNEKRLLKVFEGGEFTVGDVTLTISQILDKTVQVESQTLKMRWSVGLGQNLSGGWLAAAEASRAASAKATALEGPEKPGDAPGGVPKSPEGTAEKESPGHENAANGDPLNPDGMGEQDSPPASDSGEPQPDGAGAEPSPPPADAAGRERS